MKNLFLLLVVIIIGIFISCQKEEFEVSVDIEAIRAELVKAPVLTKEEVAIAISAPVLKSGTTVTNENVPVTLIQIFPLSVETYVVNNTEAIKFSIYYELNSDGLRLKMLTISQTYPIINGKVDLNQYSLAYEVGCPYSRFFYFKNQNDIVRVIYFFRFNDGRQFAYIGEMNSGSVKLPPIADGKWQLSVLYNDGDMAQEFATELIDYYNSNSMLNLKFEIKKDNIISYAKFDKILTQGAYMVQLCGEDSNGNIYVNYRFMSDQSLPNMLSYGAPFKIKYLNIYSMGGGSQYRPVIGYTSNGIEYLTFK